MEKSNFISRFSVQMDNRYEDQEGHRREKKQSYIHVMRAKLYGVIAVNTLEGINNELDNILPSGFEKGAAREFKVMCR